MRLIALIAWSVVMLVAGAMIAGADTILISTNNYNDLSPTRDWVTNVADDIRITHTVTDGATAQDLSSATSALLRVEYTTGGWTNDVIGAAAFGSSGTVQWYVPDVEAGQYRLRGTVYFPGQSRLVYDRYLTVTSVPAAAATVTVNPTSSISVVNNIYITNATYVTGGLISNVVTGTSNYWDTSTGTLHINQDGCQSYTIGTTSQAYNTVWQIDDCTVLIGTNAVTTLGGYTAQQIADLERSTANFDFTVLAWTPTVSVSRADGVFQYLTTEGPTWVQVPAGLTNMGYMINLDVAATTNSITFLPDNILIATNLYTYTNRTMTFLLHNPWNEETVGVYGLKRDND